MGDVMGSGALLGGSIVDIKAQIMAARMEDNYKLLPPENRRKIDVKS
jgi:hypothetical protein